MSFAAIVSRKFEDLLGSFRNLQIVSKDTSRGRGTRTSFKLFSKSKSSRCLLTVMP